jgi:hypothetical protein
LPLQRSSTRTAIKSGGQWISSIDIENIVVGCPGVLDAAVIGIPHPKWEERPLLVVVPKPDANMSAGAIKAFLDGKIAKWWMPDDVVFAEALTYGGDGQNPKDGITQAACRTLSVTRRRPLTLSMLLSVPPGHRHCKAKTSRQIFSPGEPRSRWCRTAAGMRSTHPWRDWYR